MKWLVSLLGFFGFLASPLWATDIDFYLGLDWAQPAPDQEIHLLGIYPSDLPEGVGNYKILSPKENPTTRHGALLSHIILEDDSWLQAGLVEKGQALVMPVYEMDWGRLYTLKNIEVGARLEKRGLWSGKPIVCAWAAKSAFDTFSIIQGQLTEAANVRGTIYLNFGADYRDDFTIKITRKNFKTLTEDTQNALTRLTETPEPDMVPELDIIIEARGWVFFSGGPMIDVKTDAQLDFLDNFDPFIIERCKS